MFIAARRVCGAIVGRCYVGHRQYSSRRVSLSMIGHGQCLQFLEFDTSLAQWEYSAASAGDRFVSHDWCVSRRRYRYMTLLVYLLLLRRLRTAFASNGACPRDVARRLPRAAGRRVASLTNHICGVSRWRGAVHVIARCACYCVM